MKIRIQNVIMIMIGSAIIAFGLNYFTIANELMEGGFTGISLLLNYMFGFSPAIVNLLLNIPLFIIGWRIFGNQAMAYTILGTVSLSISLWLTSGWQRPMGDDLFLVSLYAGVCVGLGLGIIFRFGGTTGGVDIIARIANRYFGWSMGRTMFVFDVFVIGASVFQIGQEKAMYTLVAVFVGARIIDFVQEGAYAAKAATIISDSAPLIADTIMSEMERGATLLKGRGGYTGSDKEVLYCVVSRSEIIRLKNLVRRIDSNAFIVVNDVHDVLGEGFSLSD
ncbi:MAG: YitT family protein [Bacilli bacterium]